MPDELHRNARLAVQGLLEGEDHEREVHETTHRPDPAPSPRPELGADVVDDGYAEPAYRSRDPEIDLRKVHRHEYVRPLSPRPSHHLPIDRVRPGRHCERLRQPGRGQPPVVGYELRTAVAQSVAAQAEDAHAGIEIAQRAGQRAGVQVSRRLPAGNQNVGQLRRPDEGLLDNPLPVIAARPIPDVERSRPPTCSPFTRSGDITGGSGRGGESRRTPGRARTAGSPRSGRSRRRAGRAGTPTRRPRAPSTGWRAAARPRPRARCRGR